MPPTKAKGAAVARKGHSTGHENQPARTKRHDAIVCLGAVVRGETPHFDYVCAETSRGIAEIALEGEVGVGFGLLTTETLDQAAERAGGRVGNKGWEAAVAAFEMASLLRKLR